MYRKNTTLEPEEQDRIVRLYRWLYAQEPPRTLASIARELNICSAALAASLRRHVMPRERYRALRKIGLPADVLPKPGFFVPGRNGGYVTDDAAYD